MLVVLPVTLLGLLCLFVTSVVTEKCISGFNCNAPTCGCPFRYRPPGGIHTAMVPQMVLLSFQYAVNASDVNNYTSLIEGVVNPNGCPARGTFFVQETDTSPTTVKSLHAAGHEIGVTTPTGKHPPSHKAWNGTYSEVKTFLHNAAGLNASDVTGSRAPGYRIGFDAMFQEMARAGLTYDSSCVLDDTPFRPHRMMWPYTHDFPEHEPQCFFGYGPFNPQKGVWQFHTDAFSYGNDIECRLLSYCNIYLKGVNDTADFLHYNFNAHYKYNRTPYVLAMDPDWFKVPFVIEGTNKFLRDIRSTANDTWIVTHRQALDWISNPVPNSATGTYKPWAC